VITFLHDDTGHALTILAKHITFDRAGTVCFVVMEDEVAIGVLMHETECAELNIKIWSWIPARNANWPPAHSALTLKEIKHYVRANLD
jgi:hypothetical protein